MLHIQEHALEKSISDGFGARVFEVWLEGPKDIRNILRFETRAEAERAVEDIARRSTFQDP